MRTLALLLLVLLPGCRLGYAALAPFEAAEWERSTYRWHRSGASASDLERARAACLNESGLGVIEEYPARQRFNNCMIAAGWKRMGPSS